MLGRLGDWWLLNWERMVSGRNLAVKNGSIWKSSGPTHKIQRATANLGSLWILVLLGRIPSGSWEREVWQQAEVVSMVQRMEEREPSWEKPLNPVGRGWGVSKERTRVREGLVAWRQSPRLLSLSLSSMLFGTVYNLSHIHKHFAAPMR